ncbi:MAG: hypothetical protein AB7I38_00355 [Dehalococcoidia bacterium]
MDRSKRWLLPSAFLAAAVAFLLVTYTVNPFGVGDTGAAAGSAGETESTEVTSYLYVQTSRGGSLRDLGNGSYALELSGVAPRSTYFGDRPARDAGTVAPDEMIRTVWEPDLPAPNAALVATNAAGDRVTAPFELTQPTYDAASATMTFTANLLETLPQELENLGLADEGTLAGDFADADLFIDTTFNHCNIEVENYTNVPFELKSKDPSDDNRWGPGDPPTYLNPNAATTTFKYKYRSNSAQKSGQVVYYNPFNSSETLTLEWTCRGNDGLVRDGTASTHPFGAHQLTVDILRGDETVRYVIYDLEKPGE